MKKLGWSEDHNIHIDYRYAPAGSEVQSLADELVALRPEVIFAQSRPVTAALQKATRTIPVVFTFVIDPVGAGFVASYPRPGSNLTGFVVYEPSVVGKWMEMLKEIAPQTARVMLLGNPKTAVYYDYLLYAAQTAAPSLNIEVIAGRIENDASDIERAIATVASASNASMVAFPDSTTNVNNKLIIGLAARYRLPAVDTNKLFVAAGGLRSQPKRATGTSTDQIRNRRQCKICKSPRVGCTGWTAYRCGSSNRNRTLFCCAALWSLMN